MCGSKDSSTMAAIHTPPSYSVAGGLATALESTPLPFSEARPPSYRETSPMASVLDEKSGAAELVTRKMSTESCPSANCPSKLPQSYSAPQSRRRGCGGCCRQTQPRAASLTTSQALSTSFLLLNEALSSSAMHKPTSKDQAKANIQALKSVLREVKNLRRGCRLSCQDKKSLKHELEPMESDVKAVLTELKKERCRMC